MKTEKRIDEVLSKLLHQGFIFDESADTCCHCSFTCTTD